MKNSVQCLWGAILNSPPPFYLIFCCYLGMWGIERSVSRLFGNKVLRVAPGHSLPFKQLILCTPHHDFGAENERDREIVSPGWCQNKKRKLSGNFCYAWKSSGESVFSRSIFFPQFIIFPNSRCCHFASASHFKCWGLCM